MWISGWEIQKGSLNRTPMDVVTSPSWACQVRAILLYVYYVIICHYMLFLLIFLERLPQVHHHHSRFTKHPFSLASAVENGIPHPIQGTKDEETMNVLRWIEGSKNLKYSRVTFKTYQ